MMKIKKIAQQKLAKNVRFQALIILAKVEHEGEYSNVLIDRFLVQSTLNERDNQLLVQLVYGTIQRRLTLDFYLEPMLQGKKVDQWVKSLLRLTLFQFVYLERIPSHAALNEAVTIAKLNGHQAVANFVNAVLRRFLREEKRDISAIEPLEKRLSIQYSIQPWIVQTLLEQFSEETVEPFLASLLEKPCVSARINQPPSTRETVLEQLREEGFEVEASAVSPYGVRCLKGNLVHSQLFKTGQLTIQDESSMLVAPAGNLEGFEQVLDACAAPGGKATHIAHLLPQGRLTALDISAAKLAKVQSHLERLGLLERVTLKVCDAGKFLPQDATLYDRIYLDAPCSGLGLMRRKPEIKYLKQFEDVEALAAIQATLLNHVATLLKPGGTLIYSTCTLTPAENEQQIEAFLAKHSAFKRLPLTAEDGIPQACLTAQGDVQVLPHQYHTDGFYICRLVKM
ncbi:MAG: 16S rRNA (cytosine(967)-C(5))-methyltransferase RsmB [Aerococcaceae bacterium]|nr:16S rRNA (cytosine(967)-C(5))-methyltransferase RsmB [Aerococcaceae bacterium]